MALYLFIVLGSIVVLTGSALLALRWAARTGQLRHFQKTALSIFDEEEPVGRMTDFFPGQRPPSGPDPRADRLKTERQPGSLSEESR
jgi:hypothetical protein